MTTTYKICGGPLDGFSITFTHGHYQIYFERDAEYNYDGNGVHLLPSLHRIEYRLLHGAYRFAGYCK